MKYYRRTTTPMSENLVRNSDETPDEAPDEDLGDDAFSRAFNGPLTNYALEFGHLDQLAADLAKVKPEGIAPRIIFYGGEASRLSTATIQSGALAIILAWACGTALNIAKTKLPHGKFGPWRAELLRTAVFDVRTAQRYMELAKKYDCVKDLTEWKPSLRQAYLACGILPAPSKSEKPADKNLEARARVGLLKSVGSVQKKLLRFGSKKMSLDDDTRKDLLTAKSEIDQLFKDLIG